MEEIKSRGKRTDNGKWVYGYYVTYGWTDKQKPYIVPDYASDLYAFEVDPATVGQFTGLKDKNGKEIYEGDILDGNEEYRKICGNPVVKIGEYVDEDLRHLGLGGEETFPLQGVYIETLKGNAVIANDCTSKYFEVIGSIHDNPEFLGGAANA